MSYTALMAGNIVKTGELTGAAASLKYEVSQKTIIGHVNGPIKDLVASGRKRWLNDDDEAELADNVIYAYQRGVPISRQNIREIIRETICVPQNKPLPDRSPSDKWFRQFFQRHPHISEVQIGQNRSDDESAYQIKPIHIAHHTDIVPKFGLSEMTLQIIKNRIAMRIKPARPKVYTSYGQQNLMKAVEAVRKGKLNNSQAAAKYGIPRQTLHGHVSGKVQNFNKPGKNRMFDDWEEGALVDYLLYASQRGVRCTRQYMRTIISLMLLSMGKEPLPVNGPSDKWFRGFFTRHERLSMKISVSDTHGEPTILHIPSTASHWFQLLEKTLEELNLSQPRHIFCCSDSSIASTTEASNKLLSHDDITVTMCISAAGVVVPSFIVYRQQEGQTIKEEQLPCGGVVKYSASGCLDSEMFYQWFVDVFLHHCGDKRPVLLLLDAPEIVLSMRTLLTAQQHKIHMLAIPPHMSSCQPLNAGVFDLLKQKLLDTVTQLHVLDVSNVVTRQQFAHVWPHIVGQISSRMVKTVFANSGFFPLNKSVVENPSLPLVPSGKSITEGESTNEVTSWHCSLCDMVIPEKILAGNKNIPNGILKAFNMPYIEPATTNSPRRTKRKKPSVDEVITNIRKKMKRQTNIGRKRNSQVFEHCDEVNSKVAEDDVCGVTRPRGTRVSVENIPDMSIHQAIVPSTSDNDATASCEWTPEAVKCENISIDSLGIGATEDIVTEAVINTKHHGLNGEVGTDSDLGEMSYDPESYPGCEKDPSLDRYMYPDSDPDGLENDLDSNADSCPDDDPDSRLDSAADCHLNSNIGSRLDKEDNSRLDSVGDKKPDISDQDSASNVLVEEYCDQGTRCGICTDVELPVDYGSTMWRTCLSCHTWLHLYCVSRKESQFCNQCKL